MMASRSRPHEWVLGLRSDCSCLCLMFDCFDFLGSIAERSLFGSFYPRSSAA